MVSPLTAGALPERIDRFRIDGVAGVGGMGLVLRATDTVLERPVALKVLTGSLDLTARERLIREAKHLAALQHPHVVEVYDAGESDDLVYVAMRWVDGPNLEEALAADGAFAPERAARVIAEVAGALDAAHDHGLIHRDVKPANVLLCALDEHALLADFGITTAQEATQALTASGEIVATADYAAPEQIEGRPVDGRADVYALGGVAFTLLTQSVPYPREGAVAKLWAHVNEPPPSVRALWPQTPQAVDAAIARAMAKDPGERFATAGAFATALSAAVLEPVTAELPAVAPPAAAAAPPARRGIGRAARVGAAALAATLAAGAGAFALSGSGADAPTTTTTAPPPAAEAEPRPAEKPKKKAAKKKKKTKRATAAQAPPAAAPAPAPAPAATPQPTPQAQPAPEKEEKPEREAPADDEGTAPADEPEPESIDGEEPIDAAPEPEPEPEPEPAPAPGPAPAPAPAPAPEPQPQPQPGGGPPSDGGSDTSGQTA